MKESDGENDRGGARDGERGKVMITDKDRRRGRKTDWGRNKRDRERETGKSGRQAGKRKETNSYVTADFDEVLFHQIPVTSYSCPRRGPIVTRVSQPAALVVLIAPPIPFSSRLLSYATKRKTTLRAGRPTSQHPAPSHNCTRQVFVNRLSVGAQRDLRKGNKHAIKGTKPHNP